MKPIYVEVSDEITTVIERMKASAEPSLALVVPKGAILLQSIVNLKLAKKAAVDANKQLTLVTTDKIGRNLAAQVGLPVLSRLDATPEEEPEPTEGATEPHVIAGVKVHRYYEEGDSAETEPASIEPIVPRQIMREKERQPDPSKTVEAPITIRSIAPAEPLPPVAKPQPVVEIIRPSRNPEAAPVVATPATASRPSPSRRRLLFFALYLLLLALLGGTALAAFYLPKTTVTVSVKSQPWNKDFPLQAKPGDPSLPAQQLSGEASETVSYTSTGTKEIGDTASGTAKISYIDSSQPQPLPAGSKIQAGGLSFSTTQPATVPGAQVENGVPVAGTVTVPVTADQPGAESNLSAVNGSVPGTKFFAQIVSTTGGSSKQVAVVSETDLANARQLLTKKLQEESLAKLQASIGSRSLLFDPKGDSFTLEGFTATQAAGAQADSFQVSGKGVTRRLAVEKSAVDTLVQQKIATTESQDKEHAYVIDSVSFSPVQLHAADQSLSLVASAKGRLSQPLPTDSLRSQLVGKRLPDGLALLHLVVKDAEVSVVQQPSWWPLKSFPYSPKYLTVQATYE